MEAIIRLESECAAAWPALVDEPLGQWRMRAAAGFTGRANSTLTLGDPGVGIASALDNAVGFAQRHGIDPCAHVVVGSPVEGEIAGQGWVVNEAHPGGAESLVMTGPLTPGSYEGAEIADTPPSTWWELAAGSARPTVAQRHVLSSMPGVGYGTLVKDGQLVATVRGAVVGDLLHISRLAVRPSHRRLGLGLGMLKTLYAWAYERGARRQALQVAEHNTPAIRLYEGLGCVEHHRYRYWIPS
ncbi:GNAT superfamily N-acetyltransferase [Kibdelosporangium banguiense]|uniref:GNAT superfamily N-acetyltransferase n=1 Tax=Kibdelosporangium banguiense TaxID=1365924 RepID=A0ABS4T8P8_9PSEU|nr:GNAT family N-acetyltransferase [Kibdelosporangium banguiense]MBP2320782.1 GNAT superfamily N-acetyltransferase [Kibdelosporangium banguiense]